MKNKIITALLVVGAAVAAALVMRQRMFKGIKYWYKMTMKNEALLKLVAQWTEMENSGVSISDKLEKRGYKNIVVYGLGITGERLLNILKKSDINVKYVVDKRADEKLSFAELVRPEDVKKIEADAVIVTAICDYDDIKVAMAEKCTCPIISLEDIIYED